MITSAMADQQPDTHLSSNGSPVPVGADLSVIMPVYNEEASLPGCAESWIAVLDKLEIDYQLIILNDGSKDGTGAALAELDRHPRVRGISKDNEGHGPTILAGYHLAVDNSTWVFQVDSDDEIPASAFADVWERRVGVDAVFGVRTGRDQPADRALITKVAALTTRTLFGAKATDANVPFRLMRSAALRPVIDKLPADTFAPNVVIAAVLSRDPDKFAEVPVPHHHRLVGEVSIVGLGAVKAAARSFGQTLRLVRKFR